MPTPPKQPSVSGEYPLQEALSLAVDAATETLLGSTAGMGFKLASTIAGKVQQRKADRIYAEILCSWAGAAGAPVAEFELILWERALDDPAFQDRIYDTFRHTANVRSEAAFPYIAMLTAPYAVGGKPPDEFFRRVAWLLERCEDEDIPVLRQAAHDTNSKVQRRENAANATVTWDFGKGPTVVVEFINAGEPIGVSITPQTARGSSHLDGARQLLVESRIGHAEGVHKVSFALADGHIARLTELFAWRS